MTIGHFDHDENGKDLNDCDHENRRVRVREGCSGIKKKRWDTILLFFFNAPQKVGQEPKEEVLFRTLPSQVPQPTCYWNGSWGTFLDPAPLFEHPSKTIGAGMRNRPVLGIPACGGDLKLLLRLELKILKKLRMSNIASNVLILERR